MRNKNARIPDINKIVSNPGTKMCPVYKLGINEYGLEEVVITGYEDQQEKINAWREQTDMAYIIHQMKMGDYSVLERARGEYIDCTEMPDNFIDAMNVLIEREQAFDELPVDVKQKFDNNFRIWINSFGSEEWLEKMNLKQNENVETDVKEGVADADA